MIRGTTAQFKFKLPKKFNEIHFIEVTFGQDGNDNLPLVLRYNAQSGINYGIAPEDNNTNSNIIVVSLEPGQSKLFSDERKGWVQMEAYCTSENLLVASHKELFYVYPMHCTTPPPITTA